MTDVAKDALGGEGMVDDDDWYAAKVVFPDGKKGNVLMNNAEEEKRSAESKVETRHLGMIMHELLNVAAPLLPCSPPTLLPVILLRSSRSISSSWRQKQERAMSIRSINHMHLPWAENIQQFHAN
eukprot:887238-Rhodomonas_salina.1